MYLRSSSLLITLCLLSGATFAQGKLSASSDTVKQANKAAKVFKEIMDIPDKAIPEAVLGKARCVAVFPDVIKAGFVIGGRGGRGVATCHTAKGWSAPAYFNMKGGSFGLQIGAQSTDFILLFMSDSGMNSLLSSKFEIGGDATAAAGPVGRQAGASTDLKMDAQILSYSRSKGLFAGLELKGSVIAADKDDMKEAYGDENAAPVVLKGAKPAPALTKTFPDTIGRYARAMAPSKKPAAKKK
ncbi:MAG: lipid-binding SYLF domain-containing protein [Acidobacteria bacterium]|nr:lipid-binding SYLF domain-containing protein [Acidobacteriota bacterium]MBI3426685.1 lipid-binding SYLF domain-containing protein [Acidobacteriota bacterium]